jgi:hypothetical protein
MSKSTRLRIETAVAIETAQPVALDQRMANNAYLRRMIEKMVDLLDGWMTKEALGEQRATPEPPPWLLAAWGDLPDDAGLLSIPPSTPPQKAAIPMRALTSHVAGKVPYLKAE